MHLILTLTVLMHPHHRFWVMDDLTASGSAGADVVYGDLDDPLDTEVLLVEPELALKVAPNFKLMLELPLGIVFYETPIDEDETAGFLGNLMLGAMFLSTTHGQGTQTSFGASISYQGITASDEGEEGFGAGSAALFYALRDYGRYNPDTSTIRFHGGARLQLDRIIFQGELGLHLHLFDDHEERGDDDLTILRIGLGLGVLIDQPLAILAEITTTSFAFEDDNDDLTHTIDVGVRYESGNSTFSVRLLAPLDDEGSVDAIGLGLDFLSRFY
jgi:hypothetical protein